jgi:hypothetical protein
MAMMTLSGDRLSYYKTSDVAKMRKKVQSQVDFINKSLGFYPIIAETELLSKM